MLVPATVDASIRQIKTSIKKKQLPLKTIPVTTLANAVHISLQGLESSLVVVS